MNRPHDDSQALWQRRSVALLAELIDRGAAAGLPALWWTVAGVGSSLVGQCLDDTTDPRATFRGWAALIGATPAREQHFDTGRTHLHAIADSLGWAVTVAITADIWPTPDRDGDHGHNGDGTRR